MAAMAAMALQTHHTVKAPTEDLLVNLSWVCFILESSPNVLPLWDPTPINLNWRGDASLSFGIGVVIGAHWNGNQIVVLCYPVHTTHIYQGLDVIIFAVLKHYLSKERD